MFIDLIYILKKLIFILSHLIYTNMANKYITLLPLQFNGIVVLPFYFFFFFKRKLQAVMNTNVFMLIHLIQ